MNRPWGLLSTGKRPLALITRGFKNKPALNRFRPTADEQSLGLGVLREAAPADEQTLGLAVHRQEAPGSHPNVFLDIEPLKRISKIKCLPTLFATNLVFGRGI